MLLTLIIKGILFEYYTVTGNNEVYENINHRAMNYRNKINQNLTEERYIIRKGILERIETFE